MTKRRIIHELGNFVGEAGKGACLPKPLKIWLANSKANKIGSKKAESFAIWRLEIMD